MKEIWAIVLAAGESKRMKVPKMLLPFDGLTMVEKVILNVTGSNVSNTLVVLGSYREEILGAMDHLEVHFELRILVLEGVVAMRGRNKDLLHAMVDKRFDIFLG